MVKIIMHGCCGHMGQVISQIVKEDADAQIVAGIDPFDNGKMEYPVYKSLEDCKEEAHLQKQRTHCLITAEHTNFRL